MAVAVCVMGVISVMGAMRGAVYVVNMTFEVHFGGATDAVAVFGNYACRT